MAPDFLLPETLVRENGTSKEFPLGDAQGKVLALTLGITRIIEQESLDVSIYGSPNGIDWSPKPLLSFPQKFYCGTYTIPLDLRDNPDVQFLRAQWKVNRWGRGDSKPLFEFYVFAEEAPVAVAATR